MTAQSPPNQPAQPLLPRIGPLVLMAVVLILDVASKHWAATELASAVHPLVVQANDGPTVAAALQKRGWSQREISDAVRGGLVARYLPVHGLDANAVLTPADLTLDLIAVEGTGLLAPRRWKAQAQDLGQPLGQVLATAWRMDAAEIPGLLQHAWKLESRVPEASMPLTANEIVGIRDHAVQVMTGFSFVYAENFGAAWSFLATAPAIVRHILFVATSSIATLVMLWVIWRRKMATSIATWALGAILGGAAGNLIDRVRWRAVVDFIFNFAIFDESSFWGKTFGAGLHGWPVYNVADIGITVGVIVIALDSLRKQPEKQPPII